MTSEQQHAFDEMPEEKRRAFNEECSAGAASIVNHFRGDPIGRMLAGVMAQDALNHKYGVGPYATPGK